MNLSYDGLLFYKSYNCEYSFAEIWTPEKAIKWSDEYMKTLIFVILYIFTEEYQCWLT